MNSDEFRDIVREYKKLLNYFNEADIQYAKLQDKFCHLQNLIRLEMDKDIVFSRIAQYELDQNYSTLSKPTN